MPQSPATGHRIVGNVLILGPVSNFRRITIGHSISGRTRLQGFTGSKLQNDKVIKVMRWKSVIHSLLLYYCILAKCRPISFAYLESQELSGKTYCLFSSWRYIGTKGLQSCVEDSPEVIPAFIFPAIL